MAVGTIGAQGASLASPSLARVIAASAAGTAFEWYDFFVFVPLATIIAKQFSAGLTDSAAFLFALGSFAVGFAFRPVGALVFGRIGDRRGAQGRLHHHRQPDGRRDLLHRPAAQLRPAERGLAGARRGLADPVRGPAHGAGHSAGRRVRRRGHLRGRARPRAAARLRYQLDPDLRGRGPVRRPARHPGRSHRDGGGGVRGLGLAPAVPGLGRAAGDLVVDKAQPGREPGVRAAGGPGRPLRRAVPRRLRRLTQPETRADRAVLDDGGAGGGLVLRLLLRPGVHREGDPRPAGAGEPDDAGHRGRLRAALRAVRLAVGPDRAQVGDDARHAADHRRHRAWLPPDHRLRQPRARPRAGKHARHGAGRSGDLLAAVRSRGQGAVPHRLRHRQGRPDRGGRLLQQPARRAGCGRTGEGRRGGDRPRRTARRWPGRRWPGSRRRRARGSARPCTRRAIPPRRTPRARTWRR